MTSSYLAAAFEVLARQGSPLHYAVIARAAVHLGILTCDTKTPEIVFSSTLSRAATDVRGPFRKTAPGVYELATTFQVSGIRGTDECCSRVRVIQRATGIRDVRVILIKSLYLLRNATAISRQRFVVELGEGRVPFRLKPATSHRLGHIPRDPECSLPLELELVRAAAKLRSELEAREVMHVFMLALALLDEALVYAHGSKILIGGGDTHQRIRLF